MGMDVTDWKKRNMIPLFTVLKIPLLILISNDIVGIPNLFYQILQVIFIFVLRPFKYEFHNNCHIGVQMGIIIFFLYRHIVRQYVGISEEITTSTDVSRILIATMVFFCLISVSFFVMGTYELYHRGRAFVINLKTWDRHLKYEGHSRRPRHSAFRKEEPQDQRGSPNRKRKSPKKRDSEKNIKREGKNRNNLSPSEVKEAIQYKVSAFYATDSRTQREAVKAQKKSSLLQNISLRTERIDIEANS